MTAEIIDLDDRRPLWMVTRTLCPCGGEAVSTVHAKAPLDALECHVCGGMTARVTHVLYGEEWCVRFSEVKE